MHISSAASYNSFAPGNVVFYSCTCLGLKWFVNETVGGVPHQRCTMGFPPEEHEITSQEWKVRSPQEERAGTDTALGCSHGGAPATARSKRHASCAPRRAQPPAAAPGSRRREHGGSSRRRCGQAGGPQNPPCGQDPSAQSPTPATLSHNDKFYCPNEPRYMHECHKNHII